MIEANGDILQQALKSSPPAGRREWIALAVLVLPTLLVSMDFTVTYLAIPVISKALHPSSAQLLWITDIYGFMQAGFLITMGTLGDRIGRRRILLAGAVVFAAASVIAAFSPNAGLLIAARALLGIAGAALIPSILSTIRNMFHQDGQRALALGIWTTSFSVGTMLGPLVGGMLLDTFWWGSVYLIGIPFMLLLLVLGPGLLPELHKKKQQPFDLPGTFLSVASILTFTLGIKRLAEHGMEWQATLSLLSGVYLGIVFFRRQRHHPYPLIDLSLFRIPSFNEALIMLAVALFSWAGILLFVAQYLQGVMGMDPLTAGLWTLLSAAGGALGCILAPAIIRFARPRTAMLAGMLLLAAGMAGVAGIGGPGGFAVMITGTAVLTLGCGTIVTLGTDRVLRAAPPERAGLAAGLSETCTNLGSAFGIALLGSLGTVVYHHRLDQGLPGGMPLVDQEAARATLGGALSVSGKLPARSRHTLAALAEQAFTGSLMMAAVVSALLVLIISVVLVVRGRRIGARLGDSSLAAGSLV